LGLAVAIDGKYLYAASASGIWRLASRLLSSCELVREACMIVAAVLGLNACASTGAMVPTVAVPSAAAAWSPPARIRSSGCILHGGLPDPACTPGAIDPRVTTANTATTICTAGYTATVRPPESVTERIKRDQMAAYGLQGQPLSGYELDHLISLELGGSPDDVANLWPQPWTGEPNAHQKDAVETYLRREVCRGAIALADAQRMIATDWLGIYRSRGLQPAP
jgi:hypothetical protein